MRTRKAQLKKFDSLKKLFLPIPSIEKYLHKILLKENNNDVNVKLIKELNDKFFRVKSLQQIISEYKNYQKEQIQNKRKY